MRRSVLASVAVLLAALPCAAADLSATKSVALAASPDAIWSSIGGFCSIQKWHPAIDKCEITSGTDNHVGAIRLLTLKDGAQISEELTAYDAKARRYSYKILKSPLPVSGYSSTLSVSKGTGTGTAVEWKGTFKAAGVEDAAAVKTILGIYEAGLQNLKARDGAK